MKYVGNDTGCHAEKLRKCKASSVVNHAHLGNHAANVVKRGEVVSGEL
jgi:hypothetical protein